MAEQRWEDNWHWQSPATYRRWCYLILEAQKTNCILGHIKSRVANRVREAILSLYSAFMRPHVECCIQLWVLST